MTLLGYLGVDQYNNTFHIDKHPRKELLEKLGKTRAEKMYVDLKKGGHKHIGYVVGDLWINIYEVHDWKKPVLGISEDPKKHEEGG